MVCVENLGGVSMKWFLFTILFCVTLLTIGGCKDSITEDPDKSIDVLVPIQEGNYWIVRSEYFPDTDSLTYIWTGQLGADNEDGWYKVSWTSNAGVDRMLAKNTEDGLIYSWDTTKEKPYSLLGMNTPGKFGFFGAKTGKGAWDDGRFASYLIAKYPVEYGESWILMSDSYESSEGTPVTINSVMECINLSQNVVTEAGTFNCHVFKETYDFLGSDSENVDIDFTRYYYYAKGIGLVRIIMIDNSEKKLTLEYDLIRYHIN
jgi:hypothetical protein